MAKKAVVQGEIHISHTDRRSLMERETDQYQALYCEGRSGTISPHHHRNRYNLYVIGILTLDLIYGTFEYIYSNLFPNAGYNIGAQAKQAGLCFDDNIDLEINEIFESYNTQTVNFTLICLIVLYVLTFLYSFWTDSLNFSIPGLITVSTPIPWWLLALVFAILLPFTYSSLLITFGGDGNRDKKMVNSIIKRCDDRDHDSILILVGDKHVEPIGEKLDNEGWDVEKQRSNHTIARISQQFESN